MTVTSVPAPVAPADSATSDASTTSGDAGAPGTGFATLLAGLEGPAGRGTQPATAVKGGGRTPTGGAAPGASAPADPVTAALLGALAGIVPPDPRADAGTPVAADPSTTSATSADPAPVPSNTASEIRALAPGPVTTPIPGTPPNAPGHSTPPVATATASPAPADPALAVAASDAAPASVASGTAAQPTDPDVRSETNRTGPAPTPAEPSAPATAPAPTHTAAPTPAGTDAATNTAVAIAAGPSPVVRSDPAPKPAPVADDAMITAATAAVDHAPTASPTAAATAPPAPTAPLPPPPDEQLVAVLRPLHRGPDGTYQIHIEMRPPELGRVDMRVEMRDGVLHASIHAEHSDTADLVRAALDDLRSRLDADGVRSGQLTVDAQGAGTPGRDQQNSNPERLADGTTAASEPTVTTAPTTTTTTSDSLLDVRI